MRPDTITMGLESLTFEFNLRDPARIHNVLIINSVLRAGIT
jgi:hypothetical protein